MYHISLPYVFDISIISIKTSLAKQRVSYNEFGRIGRLYNRSRSLLWNGNWIYLL